MRFAFARHLLSVALLPFTVTVIVPAWIAGWTTQPLVDALQTPANRAIQLTLGALFAAVGLALFASSLRRFATDGEGTLAPWDPPRRLVVRGPYRYVRNPMISGVTLVLFAEAFFLDSRDQWWWAAIFATANLLVISLFEEPQLRRRFGAAYAEYCRNVPRLVPRFRPWTPPETT